MTEIYHVADDLAVNLHRLKRVNAVLFESGLVRLGVFQADADVHVFRGFWQNNVLYFK